MQTTPPFHPCGSRSSTKSNSSINHRARTAALVQIGGFVQLCGITSRAGISLPCKYARLPQKHWHHIWNSCLLSNRSMVRIHQGTSNRPRKPYIVRGCLTLTSIPTRSSVSTLSNAPHQHGTQLGYGTDATSKNFADSGDFCVIS